MTLTIELPPDVEARLRKLAADAGITAEEMAVRIIVEALNAGRLDENSAAAETSE